MNAIEIFVLILILMIVQVRQITRNGTVVLCMEAIRDRTPYQYLPPP